MNIVLNLEIINRNNKGYVVNVKINLLHIFWILIEKYILITMNLKQKLEQNRIIEVKQKNNLQTCR